MTEPCSAGSCAGFSEAWSLMCGNVPGRPGRRFHACPAAGPGVELWSSTCGPSVECAYSGLKPCGGPSVVGMRAVALVALAVPVLSLSGCGLAGGPRSDETDRVADVVAEAISYPRQESAAEYARAAMATRAAADGRLAVVGVRASGGDDGDLLGHLLLRVALPAVDDPAVFGRDEPAVTRCYDLEVGRAGVRGRPEPRSCPTGAAPVSLPPPPAIRVVPPGADLAVLSALRRTPPRAASGAVATAVRRGLRAPAAGALAPEVRVTVDGPDRGISVRGEGECLLGSRVRGRVSVWRVSPAQSMPGELSCTPETALARLGIEPPH